MLSPDGMYVSFPKDKIDVGGIKTSSVGGHGIVIAVDESGNTRGSTYGRGIKNSGKFGAARRISVPNFHPAEAGNPTEEELNDYAKKLVSRFPQWGEQANVSYVKGADYDKMVDYMEKSEQDKQGYSETPYNIYNHNCGVYGVETINQAMPWYRRVSGGITNFIPGIINSGLGAIVGLGHDVEQGKLGYNTWQGLTNFTGAGGRADMHGWSLPWGKTTGTYKQEK